MALAARRRQGRARPEEPARVRQAVAHRPGARGVGQARQVRDVLVAGAGDLPRQPHLRVRPRRQEAADLGHGDGDEHGAPPARGRRRQGHPDRGADDPLHGLPSTPRRRSCSTSWSTPSTTRWRASTTSSCGSTPAGATPTCRRSTRGESYANSIDIYLNRLKGDVWTVEATENELAEIDLFKPYANNLVEEGRGRRGQPSPAAGRHGAGRRRPDPQGARGDPGRQAGPVERLRLRPAGLQPDGRVLQGGRASPRAATSCSRSWAWSRATWRPPTRRSRRTCCPDREPMTHLPSPWR